MQLRNSGAPVHTLTPPPLPSVVFALMVQLTKTGLLATTRTPPPNIEDEFPMNVQLVKVVALV